MNQYLENLLQLITSLEQAIDEWLRQRFFVKRSATKLANQNGRQKIRQAAGYAYLKHKAAKTKDRGSYELYTFQSSPEIDKFADQYAKDLKNRTFKDAAIKGLSDQNKADIQTLFDHALQGYWWLGLNKAARRYQSGAAIFILALIFVPLTIWLLNNGVQNVKHVKTSTPVPAPAAYRSSLDGFSVQFPTIGKPAVYYQIDSAGYRFDKYIYNYNSDVEYVVIVDNNPRKNASQLTTYATWLATAFNLSPVTSLQHTTFHGVPALYRAYFFKQEDLDYATNYAYIFYNAPQTIILMTENLSYGSFSSFANSYKVIN